MLREILSDSLRDAKESGETRAAAVLALVQAALNERDVCARESGLGEQVSDETIKQMIGEMIKQRQDEIVRAEQAGRVERVEQEQAEIEILSRFLPKQLSHDEMTGAVQSAIHNLGATGLKDAGKVIASLKQEFGPAINAATAKRIVCDRLR